jgi:hypothetical protein
VHSNVKPKIIHTCKITLNTFDFDGDHIGAHMLLICKYMYDNIQCFDFNDDHIGEL